MPYVYEAAQSLVDRKIVGNGQCVALIKHFAHAPATCHWRAGAAVKGNPCLKPGTAIATFVEGRYASHRTGNHAAFYLGQDGAGVWVVDQWASSSTIRKRLLPFKGRTSNGGYFDPSNNGDAFAVIR